MLFVARVRVCACACVCVLCVVRMSRQAAREVVEEDVGEEEEDSGPIPISRLEVWGLRGDSVCRYMLLTVFRREQTR